MPCRSPVAEWQDAHFAAKYACAGRGIADQDVQLDRRRRQAASPGRASSPATLWM